MQRRTFLQSVAVGGTGLATAGCLGFGGGDSPEIEIDELSVVNNDDTSHTAEVEISHNGDTVHANSHELAAESNDASNDVSITDDLPDESGSYKITVDITDTDSETFESEPAKEVEEDCVLMEVQLLGIGDPPISKKYDSC